MIRDEIGSVFVKDFISSEPSNCTTADVALTHREARLFFNRANEISYRQMADNYPYAPCHVEGTLRYRDQQCDWQISAAATGHISCGKHQWYFSCDDCDDLLKPETDAH